MPFSVSGNVTWITKTDILGTEYKYAEYEHCELEDIFAIANEGDFPDDTQKPEIIQDYVEFVSSTIPIVTTKESELLVSPPSSVIEFCSDQQFVAKEYVAISQVGEITSVAARSAEQCMCDDVRSIHTKYSMSAKVPVNKICFPSYSSDDVKIREACSLLFHEMASFRVEEKSPIVQMIENVKDGTMSDIVSFKQGYPGAGKTETLLEEMMKTKNMLSYDDYVPNILVCPNNDLCMNNARRIKEAGMKPLFFRDELTNQGLTTADFGIKPPARQPLFETKLTPGEKLLQQFLMGRKKFKKGQRNALLNAIIHDFDILIMTPSHYFTFMITNGLRVLNLYIDEAFTMGIDSVLLIGLFHCKHICMAVDPYQMPPHDDLVLKFIGAKRMNVSWSDSHLLTSSLFQMLVPEAVWRSELMMPSRRFPLWYQDNLAYFFYTRQKGITATPPSISYFDNNFSDFNLRFNPMTHRSIREMLSNIPPDLLVKFNEQKLPSLKAFMLSPDLKISNYSLVQWEEFYFANFFIFCLLQIVNEGTCILSPTIKLEKFYRKLYNNVVFSSTVRKFHGLQSPEMIVDYDPFMSPIMLDDPTVLDAVSRVKFKDPDPPQALYLNFPTCHFLGIEKRPFQLFKILCSLMDWKLQLSDGFPILSPISDSWSDYYVGDMETSIKYELTEQMTEVERNSLKSFKKFLDGRRSGLNVKPDELIVNLELFDIDRKKSFDLRVARMLNPKVSGKKKRKVQLQPLTLDVILSNVLKKLKSDSQFREVKNLFRIMRIKYTQDLQTSNLVCSYDWINSHLPLKHKSGTLLESFKQSVSLLFKNEKFFGQNNAIISSQLENGDRRCFVLKEKADVASSLKILYQFPGCSNAVGIRRIAMFEISSLLKIIKSECSVYD